MAMTVTQRPRVAPGAAPARVQVRARHRLRRFDVGSVARVSLVGYLCVSGVLVVLAVLAYAVADAAGLVGSSQRLIASLFGFTSFRFHPLALLGGAVAAGCVLSALGALATVLATLAYNLAARFTGGVAVTVEDAGAAAQPSALRSRV